MTTEKVCCRKPCGEIRNRARACFYSRCKSICRLFDSSPPHPPLAFSSPRHCHYGPALSTLCWFPKWIASTKRLVVRNSMKNKGQTTLFQPAEISLTGDRCSFNACIRALLPPSFFSYFFLPWFLQGKFNFFLKRNREMKWCNVIVNTKIIG